MTSVTRKKRKKLGLQELRRFHSQFVPQDLTSRPYGDVAYNGRWLDGVANYSTNVAQLVGGPIGGSVDNGDQFLGVELEVSPTASLGISVDSKWYKVPEKLVRWRSRGLSGSTQWTSNTSTSEAFETQFVDGPRQNWGLAETPYQGPPLLKLDFSKDRDVAPNAKYFFPMDVVKYFRHDVLTPSMIRGVYVSSIPQFDPQEPNNVGSYIGCLTAKKLTNSLLLNGCGALKYDASLNGEGFEIVTRPATYDWLMDNVFNDDFFVEHAPYLYSWDNPRCGMHVHMDRDTISSLTEAKMVSFMMHPQNGRFIDQVAGRAGNHYCSRNSELGEATPQMATQSRLERHGAINVSGRNGGRTMEIRIFRGNVSRYGIRRNLEFCLALKAFCEVARINQLDWTAYSQWLELPANRTAFPHHARWMKKKQFIDFNFKDHEEILEVA